MMEIDVAKRMPGRPRNEETDGRVLDVARRLVVARGYPLVTMALIAAEAGVAKQTLYRRWPSKADVVLEAFLVSAGSTDVMTYVGLEATLRTFLTSLFCHLSRDGAAIRSLIASAQSDPAFLDHFRKRFADPRAEALFSILKQAIAAGDLPPDVDLTTVSDMIHGAFWYRLLLGAPLDDAYAGRLAALVARLWRTTCDVP